jgi:alpha-L-fucosidase
MKAWLDVNGEAIFATRPWDIYGEGPVKPAEGHMQEGAAKPFTHEDIRFTTKAGALYAIAMEWPESGFLNIRSMAEGSPQRKGTVERVELLGHGEPLRFEQGMDGLAIKLPEARPGFIPALKISGAGLA